MHLSILVIALLLTTRLTPQFPLAMEMRMVPALLKRPRTLLRTLRQVFIKNMVTQQPLFPPRARMGKSRDRQSPAMKPVTPLLEL